MESSAEKLLKNIEILYTNVYNLLDGFKKASTTNVDNIEVLQKDLDGNEITVTVNSFQKIENEIKRIDSNYKSLINSENISYSMQPDGSITQLTKTSFMNAEYLSNFVYDVEKCVVDKSSNIDDLVFPSVKLPITIDSKIKSDIKCKIFEISEGWENIQNNPRLLDIQYLHDNGKIQYIEIDRSLKLEKYYVQNFGKFTVENVVLNGEIFEVILNDIKYTGLNVIGNSIDLKIDDILVSKTGASAYKISYIDKLNKKLKLIRVSGVENINIGIDNLFFNETNPLSDSNIVNIPIKPAKKLIIFLSTENIKNISYPSTGIKLDTTDFKVTYNNTVYTLDEFFGKYVTNFNEYLTALLNETSIPLNLGIIPSKPTLDYSNFKVLQINKHLTDSKTLNQLNETNKQKQLIQNDIDTKQKTINQYQTEIDSKKFASIEEKNYRINQIVKLRQEIITLNQNLLVQAKSLNDSVESLGFKTNTQKYRIIGFWSMQEPIYSPLTSAQNIIKYDVQYRYLSKDVDTSDTISFKMVNNGKEISVAVSNWNDLQTKTLNKVTGENGKLIWETPVIDSVEDININQCSIPIQENESVEIRIRSISEAGYPIAPLKSEWSEIIRIDFPDSLKTNNIGTIVNQNNTDLNNALFNEILQNAGLLSHVSGTIKESEKTFWHPAKDIASGQYTPEQKNIPLDVCITNILKEISQLKQTENATKLSIAITDFYGEEYSILNNSTIELTVPNYTDIVNVLDNTTYGAILRQKAYIRIKNTNTIPIEIKSLIPGQDIALSTNLDYVTAPQYHNVPVINKDKLVQNRKQIIYFRNIDLNGNMIDDIFKLVKPKLMNSNVAPDLSFIDNSVSDSEKNIFFYDEINSNIKICKLIPNYNNNFNAFTIEHPLYDYNNMQNVELIKEFDRLKLYTENLKATYQSESNINDITGLGFSDYDVFSIGKNTCGAFLYPHIINPNYITVVGDTTISSLIIPKESEILIPIIFEYRMMDRLGNINGVFNYDINIPLEYSKKIGIDMLINNEFFKFDIKVSSNFKTKLNINNTLNVSSLMNAFGNETQNTLI